MGGGGDSGAGAQAEATDNATKLQREQWQTVMSNLAPFTPLAQQYTQQLQGLSTLGGQEKALGDYYNSGQFKQMSDMARYQALAGAEASGGLGSTATSNQLAFIAPQLSENWLNGQMSSAQNLANIGLGALQGQANAGQTYANNQGQLLQQQSSLAAQRANQPSSAQKGLTGALAGAGAGMMVGGPWGAAIGGGLGLLGSMI